MCPNGTLWGLNVSLLVSMRLCVSLCIPMDPYGVSMGLYGSLWGLFVSLCVSMVPYVVSMCPNGTLWGLNVSLWGLYVSLWVSMCPYGVSMGSDRVPPP